MLRQLIQRLPRTLFTEWQKERRKSSPNCRMQVKRIRSREERDREKERDRREKGNRLKAGEVCAPLTCSRLTRSSFCRPLRQRSPLRFMLTRRDYLGRSGEGSIDNGQRDGSRGYSRFYPLGKRCRERKKSRGAKRVDDSSAPLPTHDFPAVQEQKNSCAILHINRPRYSL